MAARLAEELAAKLKGNAVSKVTNNFLDKNNLKMVVRSHEMKEKGYEVIPIAGFLPSRTHEMRLGYLMQYFSGYDYGRTFCTVEKLGI